MSRAVSHVLLAVILIGQLLSCYGFTVTQTAGGSGDECEPSPQCVEGGAQCISGRCQCDSPAENGWGHFACFRNNEVMGVYFNDPKVVGYDGNPAQGPISCMFRLTQLQLPICDTSNPFSPVPDPSAGQCDIEVLGWGKRRKGKTFIGGVDIRFLVVYNGNDYHHLTRIIATADNGIYTFEESTNTAPFGEPSTGPALNTTIPGLGRIYTTYDYTDNFARVTADMCGVEFGIRGVDQTFSHMGRTSGLYSKIQQGCNPTYVNPESCLLSPPLGEGARLADYRQELSTLIGEFVTLDEALFDKAITTGPPQNFPDAPTAIIQQLMDTANECDPVDRIEGIRRCLFILDQSKFLKCYDQTENFEDALTLLDMCLFTVCEGNQFTCLDVKQQITDSECTIQNQAQTIMTYPCND